MVRRRRAGARARRRPHARTADARPRARRTRWLRPLLLQASLRTPDRRGAGGLSRPPRPRPVRPHDPADWSFEVCADDLRAFCDAVGIVRPTVLGHSMGGWIVLLYGARHPGHAGGLILQSTMARFDLERLVDGFRRRGGEEVAELAKRDFGGDPITVEEWARVFAVFGPHVPSTAELARRVRNPDVGPPGMELLRRLDVVDQLARITCPTLICVGELDPVTPVAASREIVDALPPQVGRFEVIERAGHFPWLDRPDRYWSLITAFVTAATVRRGATETPSATA
ncbi:MAG TPA: alpha/beta hydrolase [Candidatus Limnocylindrales bacterium]|nr:alpha/beta hydrolase [Candidatus Limnocylindrales bacterium]